ncbi:unnamed protein product [Adineta steineri]|uniref:Cadherin domain-containing protein n=1 Tax=Adineta steineri TaxID=433720 RepID=A0A814SJZ7_9BILA|nr:unnamed protein product [Adineta steineri]
MIFFLFFLSFLTLSYSDDKDYQIINIHINEELPVSTILFITPNNIIYRLFDSGRNQNSFIYYNTSNGHVLLEHLLDREDLCLQHICSCSKCQLIIELIEWQTPYRLLRLILNIEDINDHKPKFSSEIYQLNIIENVPFGYELPLESAYDTDLGENGRINYELLSLNDGPFELIMKINGGIALKVIKKIDREEKDFYEYDLIAFDYGQPRQQSSAKLYIKIDDMNDNSVELSETYIHLHVSENTPVGTELAYINATDKDIGLNGKIHYSISNGFPSSSWMDYFRIGESTGILTLVNSLDYEIEQSYRLTVQVRDLGENSLSSFVSIDISILDENDNYPQAFVTFVYPILNNSIISIPENIPIGQILAHISISDQDSGLNSEMSYKIEEGNDIIGIKILDQKSFLLIINHLIDREDENIKSNKFILIISDNGKPSKSIRLEYQINIIDLNDSPPKFNQSLKCNLHLNISINQTLDQPLFKVQATDLDLNDNSLISYSILSPYDDLFMINDQGEIFNLEYLNHSYYHFQIMAIDHGKPIRLNSTYDCYISISITKNNLTNSNKSILLIDNLGKFKYYYSFIVICLFLIIIFSMIGIIFYFYKFIFNHRKCYKENKTYHLYVSIPRKSIYIENESPCSSKIDDNESEEHERLVHLNDKDSLSDHHQFSRTVQSSYSSSISSTAKLPHDSAYESVSLSKQNSQRLSLSTTCTSIETESSCKLKNSNSTVVRLAEEENIDV